MCLALLAMYTDLACVVADTTASVPQHTRMCTTLDMAKFHVTDDRLDRI